MNKIKSIYSCQNCGSESPKWVGKCSSCNEWNTFVEEVITIDQPKNSLVKKTKNSAYLIHEVPSQNNNRIKFIDNEFNRVLGGGLVACGWSMEWWTCIFFNYIYGRKRGFIAKRPLFNFRKTTN